jgi:hypothetical protein
MAIFRGVGGSGDSSDNSFLQEVTAQANAAEASATSAANSLASIQETEVTSASFDTSDGVLTLTKTGGATVTADLDGRFLTSYTETDPVFSAHVSSGITSTQISNWDTAYGWGNHASAGYLTSETSHDDVLVDGDFSSAGFMKTDGGGNYSIDTATYIGNTEGTLVKVLYEANSDTNAFTNADHTKLDGIEANATADQTGAEIKSAYEAVADTNAFTDAEKTKLSGIEASATADQTDAEIKTAYENNADTNAFTDADHTKLDGLERTVRQRFQRRGYNNTLSFNSLTTSYAQVGSTLRINSGATTAVENVLDLNISANFGDINSTNDGLFIVTVDAPNPSNETTVNLGTATYITLGVFSVSGDFTKHFSPYCGLSKNSDGSNAFSFSNQQGWDYDPVTDKTTIYFYPYQANTPSTGDTVYLHPFDWETTGTEINGDEYPIDAYNANGTVNVNQFQQIYLGYYKPERSFKIKAKETSTSESISLARVSGTYSQIIGS